MIDYGGNERIHNTLVHLRELKGRLRYELHVAINRKSGMWPRGVRWLVPSGVGFVTSGLAPLNHRGRTFRKFESDYQRGLVHDAHQINAPRLRCRFFNTPELRVRFAARLVAGREE